jgi:succinate dehydrogenase/fumarate reductase flavoprotein subunit
VKGGDFRARESNVYRLAQISLNIIDQCVAQGVPFAREYGGYLDNRSFGGAQVSRTFYARGQTGQQLLLGAYQALERQIGAGQVKMFPRTEMLDLIVVDGRARGIVTRDLITGKIESTSADAVVLARAATATSITSPPTPRAATPRPSGGRTSAARCSPIPASRRFTPPAFRSPASIRASSR